MYLGADDVPYDGVISDCANSSDADADADGYDSATFGGDDCDDARSDVHPGAPENWYDGVDQDCDGNDGDQDADGYALNYDCNDPMPRSTPARSRPMGMAWTTIVTASWIWRAAATPPVGAVRLPALRHSPTA